MKIWRICSHAKTEAAFSGLGARSFPGRWNLLGTPVVYAAESRPLALLEVLVHTDSDLLPAQWEYTVGVPPSVTVESITAAQLPADWNRVPPGLATQQLGTAWAASGRSCVLKVPSVVSPGNFNFLIHPHHRDFSKLRISRPSRVVFDPRLKSKK